MGGVSQGSGNLGEHRVLWANQVLDLRAAERIYHQLPEAHRLAPPEAAWRVINAFNPML